MSGSTPSGFQLQTLLGSGGHGEVYRARSLETGAAVALKVLRPTLAERPQFVDALHREHRILGRLSHPNIVEVTGITTVQGRPALVMELLEGTDLREKLQQEPLSAAATCEILVQLLGALAHLHDNGILHRDIKPANVFWTDADRLVLTDFGIAQADGDGTSTTGRLKGSLGYMAPERFRGVALPASDLYAAGLLAWELLTGVSACPSGDLASRMHWHVHIGPPDPRDLVPGIPAALCSLLAALLAPEPHERPEDGAAACALMCQLGLTAEPTLPHREPSAAPPPQPPPPSTPMMPVMWVLGAVTLVIGMMVLLPTSVWVGTAAAGAAVWLQGERGGAAWASLWLIGTIGCVMPLLSAAPQSWIGAAVVGMCAWSLSAAARSARLPLSLGELAINLAGMCALCTLFWHGIFTLLG